VVSVWLAVVTTVVRPETLGLLLLYGIGQGGYANYFWRLNGLECVGCGIFGVLGGLTRGFAGVFEENNCKWFIWFRLQASWCEERTELRRVGGFV
jgi:hypothetical protein